MQVQRTDPFLDRLADHLDAHGLRANIRAVLDDGDLWLTPAYSLAIQTEALLDALAELRS